MFNPYVIIIVLFTLGGVVMAIWGWRILQRSKRVCLWPTVVGEILSSELPSSQFEAFSPRITFRYEVGSVQYQTQQNFSGVAFSQEYCKRYIEKYPVGAEVQIYYDPEQPDSATLEPSLEKGDWMVMVVGILAAVLGLGMLLFGA